LVSSWYRSELEIVHEVYNATLERNWGFVPISMDDLLSAADGEDPVSQVVRQLMAAGAALEGIRDALMENPPARPVADSDSPADVVDLTRMEISRGTLQRIWELVEQDRLRTPAQTDGAVRLPPPAGPM
jgi:hypothetical protein